MTSCGPGNNCCSNSASPHARRKLRWPPTEAESPSYAEVSTSKPARKHAGSDFWIFLEYIGRRREDAERGLEPYYDRLDLELLQLLSAEGNAGRILREFRGDLIRPDSVTSALGRDVFLWFLALDDVRQYRVAHLAREIAVDDEP